jgi:hypothetical protein
MAQRENLVPVPTVDRNGRQTTVYKRGYQQGAVLTLPNPVMAYRDCLRDNLNLIKDMVGLETDGECRLLLSNLQSYSREFQRELNGMLTQDDEVLATAIAAHVLNRDPETFIRECASLLPELDVDDLEYGASLVSSLREHPQLPWAADYSRADDRLRSQCLALMHTVAAVEAFSTGHPELNYRTVLGAQTAVLTDGSLAQAVIDHPEDAPEIIRVIRECRLGTYAAVSAVLDGTNPSIAEGVL